MLNCEVSYLCSNGVRNQTTPPTTSTPPTILTKRHPQHHNINQSLLIEKVHTISASIHRRGQVFPLEVIPHRIRWINIGAKLTKRSGAEKCSGSKIFAPRSKSACSAERLFRSASKIHTPTATTNAPRDLRPLSSGLYQLFYLQPPPLISNRSFLCAATASPVVDWR
jgi:hypothetical protein